MKFRKLPKNKLMYFFFAIEIAIIICIYKNYYDYQQMDYKSLGVYSDKILEDKIENIIHSAYYVCFGFFEEKCNESYNIENYRLKNPELKHMYIINENNESKTLINGQDPKEKYLDYEELKNIYENHNNGVDLPSTIYMLPDKNSKSKINAIQGIIINKKIKFFVFNIDVDELIKLNLLHDVYENYDFRIRCKVNGTIWGSDTNFQREFYSERINISGESCFLDLALKPNVFKKKLITNGIVLTLISVVLTVLNYMGYMMLKKNKNILNLKKIGDKLQEEIVARREVEERYELAIEGSNDIIWEYDEVEKRFILSDKWNKITGYTKNIFKKSEMRVELFELAYKDDREGLLEIVKGIRTHNKKILKHEFRITKPDGITIWFSLRGNALYDEHCELLKVAGSLTDITDTKIKERRIEYLAYHDSLTGLKNLKRFMMDIKKYIDLWELKNQKGAILFIDLDNFKLINDTLGHDYGDALLRRVATEMYSVIKIKNSGEVYRIAGDEFVVIINYFDSIQELNIICKDLINIFNKEFLINNKILNITCSEGVAIYPCHSRDDKQLLINADIAMYKAKQNGKNRYEFFNSYLKEEMDKKLKMERDLNRALKNNEFTLNYQPKINIVSNEISGYEALIRWYDKEKKSYISPMEFIPLAETCGIIEELGYWIIEEVCRQINIWKIENVEFKQIAINISPVQLIQKTFITRLKQILDRYKVETKEIQLEITETTYMKDIEKNNKILEKLRSAGISIALDDFGTGYSSLSYLIDIPINTLKIDKSFVTGVQNDSVRKQIVQAIINIAHNIDLLVVAEGVENKEEMEVLKDLKCDIIQGYYYSKPMPGKDVQNFKI